MRVPGWALLAVLVGCEKPAETVTTPPPQRAETQRPEVSAALRRELGGCHADDAAPGSASFSLTVGKRGDVSQVRAFDVSVPAATLNCSLARLRGWSFPPGQRGVLSFTKRYGGPDTAALKEMIKHRTSALQHCYNAELRVNPTASGKVAFVLLIAATGRVEEVSMSDVSPGISAPLRACFREKLLGWRFPALSTSAEVSFSVVFSGS